MHDRIIKINELILHELSSLVLKEVEFPPDTLVTLTRAQTSPDLRHTNISVSVLPLKNAPTALRALYEAKLFRLLYKKLSLKPLPKIHYKIDETEEHASEIESLLDEIKKEGYDE